MPTYEYRCKACGHQFEIVQSFSDDPLTTCDVCGAELRKVFSPVGISFKGSGFYRTDSRSGTKSSPASDTSSDGSGSSGESTKEKPAAKTDGGAGATKPAGTGSGSDSSPSKSPSPSKSSSSTAKSA